jgi:hypothetical protein
MSQRRKRLYSSSSSSSSSRTKAVLILSSALVLASASASPPAFAADAPTQEQIKDAGRHFQRGVALFSEADYPGALVEFKRANEIAPNAAVLWNIGQTQYQLRNYAAALTTFEKYLNEAGSGAEHAKEAQLALDTLKSRVGKIDVTAPDGAEVSVDDESVGKAPLVPITASVGKRKITASKDGKTSAPKYVEVSAGETVKADIKVDDAGGGSGTSPINNGAASPAGGDRATEPKSNTVPIILWVGAGALAAGAVTTGILAMSADSDLDVERKAFPSSRQRLDDASSKTETFALVTDILAAGAIVVAGIALYATLSNGGSASSPPSSAGTGKSSKSSSFPVRVRATGTGIGGTF